MKNLRKLTLFTFLFSLLFVSLETLAQTSSKDVAKVIILRGAVKAKLGETVVDLKKGMWLQEGAMVQTADRSFCKMLFVDKSQMSLGPKSQMQIKTFPKNKAGIINLLKGQLRSKVSKDYMHMDRDKSKLFIKTKTAAMGVRGTDFQVNFNPNNMITSLVTFEGAVAMARLDDRMENINQRALEQVVSSRDAVIVTKGQYSGVDNASPRATAPTKINPAQLETLKKSTDSVKQLDTTSKSNAPNKQFRNPIPPGVNSKAFANKATVESKIVAAVGKSIVDNVKKEVAKQDKPEAAWAKKAAAQNAPSVAPRAGGYIDLNTSHYVPPPKDSAFDPNTNTYIVPPTLGSFDPQGGGYVPPAGTELNDQGQLVALPEADRAPASIDPNQPALQQLPPPPIMEIAPSPSEVVTADSADIFINEPVSALEPVPLPDILDEVGETFENGEEVILPEGYGQVNIHINAQ